MNEICGDNRFEIIAKAKAHLLDATNIDTSEDEMKVLDSFLFRCWQMGWLDKYDEQSSSEKPNNCTNCECTDDCTECHEEAKWCKTEPQTNADQHVQHVESVETMSCEECKHWIFTSQWGWFCPLKGQDECHYEPIEDEPQTDCHWK